MKIEELSSTHSLEIKEINNKTSEIIKEISNNYINELNLLRNEIKSLKEELDKKE